MKCFVTFVSNKDNNPVPPEEIRKMVKDQHLKEHFKKYPINGIEWGYQGDRYGALVTFQNATDMSKAVVGKDKQPLPGTSLKTLVKIFDSKLGFTPDTTGHLEMSPKQNSSEPLSPDAKPFITTYFREKFGSKCRKEEKKDHFPYRFVNRKDYEPNPYVRHDILSTQRVDVAFEIVWTPLSPVAHNPCSDPTEKPDPKIPKALEGLDRRWLIIDKKLIISPFTVKSAIASGFANLMGACYRVPNEPKGHSSVEPGTYPYSGCYKRYRVAMNSSKPGIIKHIEPLEDGSRMIVIQPVEEIFYDEKEIKVDDRKYDPRKAESFYANVYEGKVEHKVFIKNLSKKQSKNTKQVSYHGPYRFGMDLSLKPGDLGIKHYHRFYQPIGGEIKAHLPSYHFYDKENLKRLVYLGEFRKTPHTAKKDPRDESVFKIWYEDLSSLKAGDWIYYQSYERDGKTVVTNIGKNFQFKAVFHHEETVPDGHKLCVDIRKVCPRCSLFGIVQKIGEEQEKIGRQDNEDTVGYRGRFLASALISNLTIDPVAQNYDAKIPSLEIGDERSGKLVSVKLKKWLDSNGKEICKQFLMPVFGPPKPSKRDINLYYDKKTGLLKGAKRYFTAVLSWEEFENTINETNSKLDLTSSKDYRYGHKLRRFAMVAKPDNLWFSGTVGIEQASVEEVAAMMILLHTPEFHHAFQIGLGKSLGLGTMESCITGMWIRTPQNYEWQYFGITAKNSWTDLIKWAETHISGLQNEMGKIRKIAETRNLLDELNSKTCQRKLVYPPPGNNYSNEAKNRGLTPVT